MTSVTSISGGKTSAYLALQYPTDVNIFAVVCVDCHQPGSSMDPALRQAARDRLAKTSPQWPEFRSTTEDPATLRAVLDLEQMLGREIVWVRGMGWEDMMQKRKAVPNQQKRFCTSVMKMKPIFWYLYLNHGLPVRMQIGYRYDEQERAQRASTFYKFSPLPELFLEKRSTTQKKLGYKYQNNAMGCDSRGLNRVYFPRSFPCIYPKRCYAA